VKNIFIIFYFLKRNFRMLVFYQPSIGRNPTVEVPGSSYDEVLGSTKLVGATINFN
jgi:hypothetical protein